MEVEYRHASKLPPGFRFDPTNEELVLHFLYRRALSMDFDPSIIPDLDLCSYDPWDLNGKAFYGCNKWYFYSKLKDEADQERETKTGYWQLQEDVEDEAIFSSSGGGGERKKVGWKRLFVFFIGEAPLGIQTGWVLEEYHLCRNGLKGRRQPADIERWVLCRVLEINDSDNPKFRHDQDIDENNEVELSSLDEVFLSFEEDDLETME